MDFSNLSNDIAKFFIFSNKGDDDNVRKPKQCNSIKASKYSK